MGNWNFSDGKEDKDPFIAKYPFTAAIITTLAFFSVPLIVYLLTK